MYKHTSFYCALLSLTGVFVCFTLNGRQDPPLESLYCNSHFITVVWNQMLVSLRSACNVIFKIILCSLARQLSWLEHDPDMPRF